MYLLNEADWPADGESLELKINIKEEKSLLYLKTRRASCGM